jgi:MOSC domain-containing protein YiiM
LIRGELHDELLAAGFPVPSERRRENITTRGVELLSLPRSTLLHIGGAAAVELTGELGREGTR